MEQKFLPANTDYKIRSMMTSATTPEELNNMDISIRLSTVGELKDWFKLFSDMNLSTWRVAKTHKGGDVSNEFKTEYRCQHKTMPRSHTADKRKGSKNCNCSARLILALRRPHDPPHFRSPDSTVRMGYLGVCKLTKGHSHQLYCADALRFRDVLSTTDKILADLFKRGHSPSTALDMLKYDLQEEHGVDYARISADRSICPDVQYCYRLYRKEFQKEYGSPSGDEMLQDLASNVASYNSSQTIVKLGDHNGQTIVAVCTPIMQRVHSSWPYSKELVFIDAAGGMDRQGCRIFFMLTHSPAGGLPLGAIITTSESQSTIEFGLQLLMSIIEKPFYGQGHPHYFMTDDCQAERNALSSVFAQSINQLCIFHVLQAAWLWLFQKRNNIPSQDRPSILNNIRSMVYSKDVETVEKNYRCIITSTSQHPQLQSYIKRLYERKSEWCIAYREKTIMRGNDTNNFAEAAFRVMKDRIFLRCRAYNLTQFVDFIVKRLSCHYERRLIDVANNRYTAHMLGSRFSPEEHVSCDDIQKIAANEYWVKSQSTQGKTYHIDMELGVCSCVIGCNGSPCKHQAAVGRIYNIPSSNILPRHCPQDRSLYYYIATGLSTASADMTWFSSLKDGHECFAVLPIKNKATAAHTTMQCASSEEIVNTDTLNTKIKVEIMQIAEELCQKIEEKPCVFKAPLQKLISNYNNITTETALVSALSTFGSRYQPKRLLSASPIHVQPTAVSRRRSSTVTRRICAQGREAGKVLKRKKAGHKLRQCVTDNVSLGKSHSSK